MTRAELAFKVATEAGEFEQIHRLNHKTFAEEIPLYHHLGFVPFGPLVGAAGVQFQPMYLTLETCQSKFSAFFEELCVYDNASE